MLSCLETAALFHATTASAAKDILARGWRAINPRVIVDGVADDCGEQGAAVWQDLTEWSRFVTQPGREGWVSFATTFESAARWAQRAPEAKWEALWAIWRLRHP